MSEEQKIIVAILWAGLVVFMALTALLAMYVVLSNRRRCTCKSGICTRHSYKHPAYDR